MFENLKAVVGCGEVVSSTMIDTSERLLLLKANVGRVMSSFPTMQTSRTSLVSFTQVFNPKTSKQILVFGMNELWKDRIFAIE